MSNLKDMPLPEALESVGANASAVWSDLRRLRGRVPNYTHKGGIRTKLGDDYHQAMEWAKLAAIAIEDLAEAIRKAEEPAKAALVDEIGRALASSKKPPLTDVERLRAFFSREWDGYVRECGKSDAASYIMGDAAGELGITDDELVRSTFHAWRLDP